MTSNGRFTGQRILVVDDDQDILDSTELAFRAEGAEVILAADGNTAVSLFLAERPDGVVLDMMLPARSGFLVLEKIKETDDPPPVVMVTANQGRRHLIYAENLGVSAYLIKPVPLQRLLATLGDLMELA
ncbi:MAG: response regulator [Proteobacteria bacterium TMED72]|nr:MAG: response regulator [Proteobacteria bacterium TMED72]RPG20400.1 MAG: response regulator [Phycisphaera sp. TMED9]RPG21187.1 MAG: response regulator [Phycisphaera sp. TMED9]